MTHIRSALVAGLLVFGGALVASAQQPAQTQTPQTQGQHMKRGPGRGHNPLMKGLTLSATEKANIKSVHGKYASQMKALRGQPKSDATRQQAKQLMAAERADMRGALSAENQAKYDANAANFKQHAGKRRPTAANPNV